MSDEFREKVTPNHLRGFAITLLAVIFLLIGAGVFRGLQLLACQ